MVEELHRLLAGAGLQPPYVLGGWSLGGFFIRLYTKRYPAEAAGLVGGWTGPRSGSPATRS